MKRAKSGELVVRLRWAENLGYGRGYADKHFESRTFTTGAEYVAWLRGWRKGQAELKAERLRQAQAAANTERIMRNLLCEVRL